MTDREYLEQAVKLSKNRGNGKKQYYEGVNQLAAINQLNNRLIELIYLPDYEPKMLSLISEWEKQFI